METYEQILQGMIDDYALKTGTIPTDESDIKIRMQVLAGEIYKSRMNNEWLKRQIFPQTATGIYLNYHAQTRGLQRQKAVKATGEISFAVLQAATEPIPIPLGTMVSTSSATPVCFKTIQHATILAGKTFVTVPIEADIAGVNGNVGKDTIDLLVTPPAGVDFIKNMNRCSGGADEESDNNLRSRLLNAYKNISNGTNIEYYKNTAMKIDGVYSVGIIPLNRGVGTVDVFISGKGVNASGDIISKVQQLIDKEREINIDVKVKTGNRLDVGLIYSLKIKDGYNFEDVKQKCISETTEYISNLGIGKSVFLSELGNIIYNVEGVANFEFDNKYSANIYIAQNCYPVLTSSSVKQNEEDYE